MSSYKLIKDKNDIKLLILFVLKSINRPITPQNLNDIIMTGEYCTYFDYAQCYEHLLESGLVDKKSENGKDIVFLTKTGLETLDLFDSRLYHSLKKRTMQNAMVALSELKKNDEISTSVKQIENGYEVNLKIMETDFPIFEITVLLPSEMQANLVVSEFKKNPGYIYKNTLSVLVGDPKLSDD